MRLILEHVRDTCQDTYQGTSKDKAHNRALHYEQVPYMSALYVCITFFGCSPYHKTTQAIKYTNLLPSARVMMNWCAPPFEAPYLTFAHISEMQVVSLSLSLSLPLSLSLSASLSLSLSPSLSLPLTHTLLQQMVPFRRPLRRERVSRAAGLASALQCRASPQPAGRHS